MTLLYSDMQLPSMLQATLARMQFVTPTPIQEQAIPVALEGRDILGTAQTGTGKTAAFSVPIVARLMENSQAAALILCPTRELATQVMKVIQELVGFKSQIKTALLIGGEAMGKQYAQLKARPRIVVGTPGRVNDHIERGSIRFDQTRILVLDEADRMLDMGFGIQIDAILAHMPQERQTLLFSATLPSQIMRLAKNYQTDPVRISVGEANAVATKVEQSSVFVSAGEKYGELLKQLSEREGSVIVFVKTKFGADRLAKRLVENDHKAEAIHGDLQQRKRDRVIQAFREKRHRILVATDVAARGLDIPHIEHVVNFDLPQMPEDYIHRIGRTARANNKGSAVNFISGDETRKWRAICELLNPGSTKDRGPRVSAAKKTGGKPTVRPAGKSNPFAGFDKKKKDSRNAFDKAPKNDNRRDNHRDRKDFAPHAKPADAYGTPERKAALRPWREEKNENSFKEKPKARDYGTKKDFPKKPREDFADKKPYDKKPREEFSDRNPRGDRAFGDRTFTQPAFDRKKPEGRTFERKQPEKNGENRGSGKPDRKDYDAASKKYDQQLASSKPYGKKFSGNFKRRPA